MPHGGVEHLLMQRRQSRENAVRSYANGGSVQATAQKLQSMGRNGDTILAHINPEEAALLKRMGGSGKINPNTGLMSFEPGFGGLGGAGAGAGATGNYGGGPEKDRDRQGPGNVGKTDTSGGPGSAPGGDGSKSGSQGMGAGAGSRPSGGIADIRADLPPPTAKESAQKTYVSPLTKKYFDAGIIPNEGGMDPKTGLPLTSPKKAHGISQVTETTGPEAAADAGLEWNREKWLTDTQYNYDIGLAYYGKLVNKYKGNYVDAAAAYNTGMGNYDKFLAGKQGLAAETQKYIKDFTAKTAGVSSDPAFEVLDPLKPYVIAGTPVGPKTRGVTIPDPQAAGVSPTDPLKALTPANVPTTPEPKLGMVDQFAHDLPGNATTALISAMFPPLGLYNVIAGGTNLITGEKTLRSTADMINDAYYGTGTTAPSTAPTAEEYEKYGAAGDGSPPKGYGPYGNLTKEEYQKQYGGGSDKPLLGIESLDRSPLLPEIDPSVPTAPLFEYDYSKFGIKGKPFTEYDYSKFGI